MVFNVSLQENMSSIPGRLSNGKLYCSIFDKLKFDKMKFAKMKFAKMKFDKLKFDIMNCR